MVPVLTNCPVCGGELTVVRLHCHGCGTTIEGSFGGGPFARLAPEQLAFVEAFVRCEGKFTRLEGDLGLSYPTLRSRLHDVIRALGYEPGAEEPAAAVADEERRRILTDLDEGRIGPEEALEKLQGGVA